MEAIGKTLLSAVVVYSTHYGASKLYDYACVPDGIWGFIQGSFTAGSPICKATLDVVANTQSSYSSIILMSITRIVIDHVIPVLS